MYEKLKVVNKILWEDDDIISQENLFSLQDYVADLLLEVAEKENKVDDLIQSFPWLYNKK